MARPYCLSSAGEDCEVAENESAICTAAAQNSWSDVLGVDPVEGTFEVEVGEAGVTVIKDQGGGFLEDWGQSVFGVFADWVEADHPEDAAMMFDINRGRQGAGSAGADHLDRASAPWRCD